MTKTSGQDQQVPRVLLSPQGPEVSQLVYGTWRLTEASPELTTPQSVLERIKFCLKSGITTFDCVTLFKPI
jgi:predicted oxidoreductase